MVRAVHNEAHTASLPWWSVYNEAHTASLTWLTVTATRVMSGGTQRCADSYPGCVRKKRTSAQCASLRAITVGFPSGYPIVHYSHLDDRSNSAQSLPLMITPLRLERSAMPLTQGILPVRAWWMCHMHAAPAVTVTKRRGTCAVYPGAGSLEAGERLRTYRTYPDGMVGYPASSLPPFPLFLLFSHFPAPTKPPFLTLSAQSCTFKGPGPRV